MLKFSPSADITSRLWIKISAAIEGSDWICRQRSNGESAVIFCIFWRGGDGSGINCVVANIDLGVANNRISDNGLRIDELGWLTSVSRTTAKIKSLF